jgi:hypothetical protein
MARFTQVSIVEWASCETSALRAEGRSSAKATLIAPPALDVSATISDLPNGPGGSELEMRGRVAGRCIPVISTTSEWAYVDVRGGRVKN